MKRFDLPAANGNGHRAANPVTRRLLPRHDELDRQVLTAVGVHRELTEVIRKCDVEAAKRCAGPLIEEAGHPRRRLSRSEKEFAEAFRLMEHLSVRPLATFIALLQPGRFTSSLADSVENTRGWFLGLARRPRLPMERVSELGARTIEWNRRGCDLIDAVAAWRRTRSGAEQLDELCAWLSDTTVTPEEWSARARDEVDPPWAWPWLREGYGLMLEMRTLWMRATIDAFRRADRRCRVLVRRRKQVEDDVRDLTLRRAELVALRDGLAALREGAAASVASPCQPAAAAVGPEFASPLSMKELEDALVMRPRERRDYLRRYPTCQLLNRQSVRVDLAAIPDSDRRRIEAYIAKRPR